MMKRLLMTTAAASLLAISSAATAQNAAPDNGQPAAQPGQPTAVTPPPAANSGAGSGTTDQAAPAVAPPAAPQANAAPPPADAVISAQSDNEFRADQLIGMTVYNAQGQKVGVVHDILLGKDGKATGVVLSVGGILGIGAKSVGLTWKEVDVKPAQQVVQISYSKAQLEAAPDFKTSDQINAEMNAQQPGNGGASSMPPAPGGTAPSPQPATQP